VARVRKRVRQRWEAGYNVGLEAMNRCGARGGSSG
jgi:hypothetical protein